MTIFNKFCLIVGQIVVGVILGLVWSHYSFKLADWIYTRGETFMSKWKMRKFEKTFAE